MPRQKLRKKVRIAKNYNIDKDVEAKRDADSIFQLLERSLSDVQNAYFTVSIRHIDGKTYIDIDPHEDQLREWGINLEDLKNLSKIPIIFTDMEFFNSNSQ